LAQPAMTPENFEFGPFYVGGLYFHMGWT